MKLVLLTLLLCSTCAVGELSAQTKQTTKKKTAPAKTEALVPRSTHRSNLDR